MSSLVWDVAIYAYGAEGADAKFLGWTQAAGAWIENEEALYLFTVGADGTLQMFKNGLLLHYSLICTHVNTSTVEVNKPQTYPPPSKMIPPPRARKEEPSGRASSTASQAARSASQTFMSQVQRAGSSAEQCATAGAATCRTRRTRPISATPPLAANMQQKFMAAK